MAGIELHRMAVRCNSSIPRLRTYGKCRWGRGECFLPKGASRLAGDIKAVEFLPLSLEDSNIKNGFFLTFAIKPNTLRTFFRAITSHTLIISQICNCHTWPTAF